MTHRSRGGEVDPTEDFSCAHPTRQYVAPEPAVCIAETRCRAHAAVQRRPDHHRDPSRWTAVQSTTHAADSRAWCTGSAVLCVRIYCAPFDAKGRRG